MTGRIIRIAVDAMGGDTVPDVPIEGSLRALQSYSDVAITLVGNENITGDSLNRIIKSEAYQKSVGSENLNLTNRICIVHADESIGMDESPVHAIRSKKKSSIVVANKLCSSGDAEAIISAGNTGAAMASSLLYMGRLKGVLRPAICAIFPSEKNIVAVLDVGANPDCKPEHLYQFAVMASIFTNHVFGYENPRVGILSIGEERTKGNELTNSAYSILEASSLNFIGNIEGRDIFKGTADVVVCDGFVGNVLLKFGESIFGFITYKLREKLTRSVVKKIGAMLLKPVFKELKQDMSPEDYGGAPLLGVDGVSIICHGNSTPVAIMNAVRVARQLVLEEVNEQIKSEFAKKR
ncbi:phosphate acyltransferase PlsX [Candidatus Latescibacterota bacterium]